MWRSKCSRNWPTGKSFFPITKLYNIRGLYKNVLNSSITNCYCSFRPYKINDEFSFDLSSALNGYYINVQTEEITWTKKRNKTKTSKNFA